MLFPQKIPFPFLVGRSLFFLIGDIIRLVIEPFLRYACEKKLVRNSIDFLVLCLTVASWRVKETERMIAICTELGKVGIQQHYTYASEIL